MTSTRTLFAATAISLAALGLAACSTESTGAGLVTPLSQYALKTESGVDRIALAPHADGLSDAQRQALKALAGRHAETGGGAVTISLPHGPADAAAAGRTADAVQAELAADGVSARRATYDSDDAKAPLLVSFDYEKAEVPRCGRWDDLTKTAENRVYGNYGCAVTANMAAQIARPSDIDHPRAEDAPDADRRMTVIERYKAGKVTGADEPTAKATISHIGQ